MISRITLIPLPRTRLVLGTSPSFGSPLRITPTKQQQKFSSTTTTTTTAEIEVPSVTLYQYKICPFCNKAKALLSYAGLKYETVEVNPLTKAELKQLPGDYRKVPIAKINDEQINGSDEIMQSLLQNKFVTHKLEEKWSSSSETKASDTMTIERFTSKGETNKWTTFANDDLAPIVYPNICRSLTESHAAFGYVDNVASFSASQRFWIRNVGALAMYFAASKIKAKRNITDEREALHNALSRWEEEGLHSGTHKFSSGLSHPSMGDIAMFGTLISVQGLETHVDAVVNRGGVIHGWYERMHDEVGR